MRFPALAFVLLASPALAQTAPHVGHGAAPGSPSEMSQAMDKMQREMNEAPMTGNADRDFTNMMVPHHRGAVDMARIYLKTARDPEMRALAQKIIADQEREIRQMRGWQAKHQPR